MLGGVLPLVCLLISLCSLHRARWTGVLASQVEQSTWGEAAQHWRNCTLHCIVGDKTCSKSGQPRRTGPLDLCMYSLPFVSCSSRAPISDSAGGLWPPQHEHWPG
ncbi:hypothetical protein CCUS01_16849 [Colletotrichum cuscutae]|uniref:Secreted protein n=1 Tax=Colletotrichum cuscutae TaxID=1209917 RepID=A0AAI9V886_9PEZI|nr:hypothetical protein CCUS01_16849 [Colletotrichum cuscutae]